MNSPRKEGYSNVFDESVHQEIIKTIELFDHYVEI